MAELLLELLSEEIPARMQVRAAADLKRLVCDGLKGAGLTFDRATAHVTPRRLALMVEGLPDKTPDIEEERKGPRTDAPEQALAGFRGSLPDGARVEEREMKKGTFFFALVSVKGRPSADVLADVLPAAIANLPWAKSMKWASYDMRWVRPLHGVVCLFNGSVVPIAVGPVTAGDATRGHRFLAPDAIPVSGFSDYTDRLRAAKVMLDADERKALIKDEAAKLATADGLRVREDEGLLNEVAGLVEWPVVMMGRIDDQFMDVPPEVLMTAMRSHQKYFSCLDADGNLANRFIVVSNMEASDGGDAIRAGNERVLRARLSDAKFFWDQDRKRKLTSLAPKLKDIVFHAKLGTLDEKVDRMQALAVELVGGIPGANVDKVRSAARLAKADLVSEMVYEFPELQGTMGRYYALNDGESDEVADAIAEHYSPLGPGDDCPSKPVSVAVALADKLDTLVGFWGIDEKPTGSKDPFALRRAALGVIRLVLENGLRLPLGQVFAAANDLYGANRCGNANGFNGADLMGFFADRLKVHLKEKGTRHDLIDAVFSLGSEDDLIRLLARVDALTDFVDSDDGANLLTAYKRAANILKIEEKKDGPHNGPIDIAIFAQDEESVLHERLAAVAAETRPLLQREDFKGAMTVLSGLRGPVDAFFDHVTVNHDDPALRANRLRLLAEIRAIMGGIAEFSKIEG